MPTEFDISQNWTLEQLFEESIPRLVFFSYVNLFLLTGNLPTRMQILSNTDYKPKDPFSWLCYSYKNYQLTFAEYIRIYQEPKLQALKCYNYGIYSRFLGNRITPVWANYVYNNIWFDKQLEVYKRLQFLQYAIPGLESIYLTASATTESTSENSDIDVIIKTKPNFVWFTRLVSKLYLKIYRIDVHNFLGEVLLTSGIFLQQFSVFKDVGDRIENWSRGRIFRYKNRQGTKIDIGLIYSKESDLSSIFKKDSKHLLFATTLLLKYSTKKLERGDFFGYGELYYSDFIKNWLKISGLFCRILLFIIYIFTIPLVFLFSRLYIYKHKNNDNFRISWSIICFYPLIYKESYYKKLS